MSIRPSRRSRIEALIERLIAQLDALDGDPDAEPSEDVEPDVDERSVAPKTLSGDRLTAMRFEKEAA